MSYVSWRDYVESRLYDLEDKIIQRLEIQSKALSLQAIEYLRRLDELNHAHALAQQKNSDYLPRDVFDATFRDWSKWREDLDAWRFKTIGIAIGAAAGGGALGALMTKWIGG